MHLRHFHPPRRLCRSLRILSSQVLKQLSRTCRSGYVRDAKPRQHECKRAGQSNEAARWRCHWHTRRGLQLVCTGNQGKARKWEHICLSASALVPAFALLIACLSTVILLSRFNNSACRRSLTGSPLLQGDSATADLSNTSASDYSQLPAFAANLAALGKLAVSLDCAFPALLIRHPI